MDRSPSPMSEMISEGSVLSTKMDTIDAEKNVKKEIELIIEDSETNSTGDDEEYCDRGAGNEEYFDTGSESSCHFDYEPEVKRPYLDLSNMHVKKRPCIRSASFAYGKYVMRQCPMCDYEFNSAYGWKQHIKFVHHLEKSEDLQFKYNEVGAKCKLCDYQIPAPEYNKLLEHQISHMPFSHYLKCKLCEWKTKTHPSMNLHLRQEHPEKLQMTNKSLESRRCPSCHQEFSSQWHLRKHMIQEHEQTIEDRTCFICLDCGLEFSTNVSLRSHVNEKFAHKSVDELGFKEVPAEGNEEAKFKCTQCPSSFRKTKKNRTSIMVSLREHYMLHLGEPSGKCAYKCRYCDESFRRFDSVRLHICEELHNALQNGGGLTNTSRLLRRRRKKAIKTDQDKKFIEKTRRRIYHKWIQHVCLKCGNIFYNLAQCRQHMFRMHGMNKPEGLEFRKLENQGVSDIYECIICEEFTCDYDLNTMFVHARIHSVFEPFQCKFCKMSFAYESDIRRHGCLDEESVQTVTESKEVYIPNIESFCPKCNQTYTRPYSLTRHMKKAHGMNKPYGLGFEMCEPNDTSEKMYCCNECKNFTAKETDIKAMLEHARQHFPFESFRCTLCNERFRLKEHASKHECSNEGKEVDDKYEENILAKTRLNNMGRFCPQCGKSFKKTYLCKIHLIKVHGIDKPDGLAFEKIDLPVEEVIEETYRCMVCLTYTTKLDLSIMLEHAREHFPFESFWCKLCNERFRLKAQAKQHKCPNYLLEENNHGENNTSSRRYPKNFDKYIRKFCPECNTEASSVSTWRWHMSKYHEMGTLSGLQMKETTGNLVECLVCQVQMTHKRRQEHRFIHLPFKPFQCKYCSEYFIEVEKAKSHCKKCALVPLELPETQEQKKEEKNSKKKVPARRVEKNVKSSVELKATKNECNKRKNKRHIVSNVHDQEESESGCENESETTNKGVCVVLADDKDFAKFVKISCPLCPDTAFDSNLYLTRHFKDTHDFFRDNFTINQTNSANCKSCDKFFNVLYKKSMIKHYLSEISATCFCCRLCDKKTLYLESMRSHLLDDHEGVIAAQKPDRSNTFDSADPADPLKVTSVDISKVSSTTMAIQTNKTTVFNEFNVYISYACPECNEPFDTSEQWHLHINGEHNFFDHEQLNIEATPDGFKRCKQCGTNISGGILAEQRHKLTHMQYKSFICTLCQHRSTTLGVLTQHFRRRHFAKGSFKCGLCSLVLNTSCERILHIRGDHDPSEYTPELCRVCFSHFSSVKHMHIHMACHDPDRISFPCEFCDRSYWYKRELNLHVRAKHPEQEAGDSGYK
ncbi:zinc finger protein Xfin-like [Rhagoletis pomonella]|uniref:zinc finger protein Xfin-like n=1 Tax=Rhagoletis pomonella TaxID=28610 RepID=UPI00177EC104|nr:zinc finger protein Xfin-like [Rhagoletis pomonella]XP_036328778.1 zinc finger protein Xfin-like [Rhagoletis pomonella]XP_036328779.1 zinc finger protein Xfin-like [Rhagoletis pomonella]XP_036328780.1 zinc finger protein Xfin-like [Rhagoletis pomonella]